ncbi:MAG: ComEC family competence protein [Prevotella sp.]|nr:ComEC family competence protein [Prevotella sp.]
MSSCLKLMPAMPVAVVAVAGMMTEYFCPFVPLWLSFLLVIVCAVAGILVLDVRLLRPYPVLAAFFFIGMFLMTLAKMRISIEMPEKPVEITATIIDAPRKTARSTMATVFVHDGALAGKKIRCYLPDGAIPVYLGQTCVMRGRLSPFKNFETAANFNYPRWAESHSLVAQMNVFRRSVFEVENEVEALPFFERIALKSKLLRARVLNLYLNEHLPPDHYALVAAMAFGDRSTLSAEMRDVFARAGVSHLLALSGLHLGIIYVLLSMVFFTLCGRTAGSVIVVMSLWLYAFLVGMPASVIRAAVMLSLYTILALGGRERLSVNALCVTVLIMLLSNPLMIWDIGFQLSVLSVLSIALLYGRIYGLISFKFLFNHFIFRKLWALAALSTSAQFGTMPLVIYYFGRVAAYFLLANIVAVPIVTVFLYCVVMSLIFWWLPLLKALFLWLVQLLATFLEWFLRGLVSLGGASIENIKIDFFELVLLYMIFIAAAVAIDRLVHILTLRRLAVYEA